MLNTPTAARSHAGAWLQARHHCCAALALPAAAARGQLLGGVRRAWCHVGMVLLQASYAAACLAMAAGCWIALALGAVRRRPGSPPRVDGMRFVPNLWHLSTRGAEFIHQCRLQVRPRSLQPPLLTVRWRIGDSHMGPWQYGDIFVVDLVFKRLTFVTHPKAMAALFCLNDEMVAFRYPLHRVALWNGVVAGLEVFRRPVGFCRPAVEHFTQRVFQLPSSQFFPQHHHLLTSLRSILTPDQLHHHAHTLEYIFRRHLAEQWASPQEVCSVDVKGSLVAALLCGRL